MRTRHVVWLVAAVASTLAGVAAVPVAARPSHHVASASVRTSPAPQSASIIIGKDAMDKGFTTKTVTMARGGSLSVVNLDAIQHTATSVDDDSSGNPLFDVFADPGRTTSIKAASKLAAGTYDFYCQFHPTMRGKLIIEGGSGGTKPSSMKFEQPLKQPKVLTSSHIHLTAKRTLVRVLPHGPKTRMWTYNGSYPGPTIRRTVGHRTTVTLTNKLPKADGSLTLHFHGDHHSWKSDGQPTRFLIRHAKSRTYVYPLTDGGRPERAAFDFYHDHRMNETSRNNWEGLQGMVITDDREAHKLHLPSGRYDVPLDLADRSFTAGNQLTDPFPKHPTMMVMGAGAPPDDGVVGSRVLVDGRVAPYFHVATHKYRLRLLNSSNYSVYDLALSDGRPLVQIGTGSGLLPHPVVRQDILLGPGQRADVVADFHGELHQSVELESIPRTNAPAGGIGTRSAQLMQFRVSHSVPDHSKVPTSLEKPPHLTIPKHVSATWTFAMGGTAKTGTYWEINGKPFSPGRVDHEVPLGSTQLWKLHNASDMTHFIHIHEEQWHTVLRDGKRPPPWERGLEDTWKLDPGETVEVAAKFTDYTGVFMLHCHMLDHEDHGMMAQFAVLRHGQKLPHGYHLAR